MDPAVQCLQVASTIAERFRTLASMGAASNGTDIAAAELRIGEANQIYPEIWQQLDRARALLVARGTDVANYDAFRAAEPQGAPGVTRVAASAATSTHYAHKSGTFNMEGYARATGAITALKTAMPGVDWFGMDQQDAALVAAAGPLGASKTGLWIGLLVAAAAIGAGAYFLTRKGGDAPSQADKIKSLEAALAATPCDGDSFAALAAAHKANHDEAFAESKYIDACEKLLKADPCNRANIAQYEAMIGGGGGQLYRDECTSKGGTIK